MLVVLDVEPVIVLTVDDKETELVVLVVDDDPVTVDEPSWYRFNRLPAPQYSYWFPGQMKLQSVMAVRTDPVLITLPQ